MAGDIRPPWRAPLLLLGFVALFIGMVGGLARLGWPLPAGALAAAHGPLMVSGFFGTVISLERAVALGRRWAYVAPLASGLGTVAIVFATPTAMAPALSLGASVVLLAASLCVYRRQRELFTLTLALGAASWLVGNLLWLDESPIFVVVPWWLAFFVLTIAGERLELSRLLPPSTTARRVFAVVIATLLGGIALSLMWRAAGTVLLGLALGGLALWLMRQDIARRTVKGRGLTRFIAVCLLSGYVWLAVGGISMVASGGLGVGGAAYDAGVHAVLLGFVFSMVFGHAPIILPAVLRVAVPYRPYFYAPLGLLHGSLLIRLVGDFVLVPEWRAWGGALNGLAVVAFVLGTLVAAIRGSQRTEHAIPGGKHHD
ncbi:MAG TPA: hypothetical protein VLN59_08950 [Burkholderiales bacterium]|nr:hypothetical protein [Burkholderiales bacterium]